MKPKRPRDKIYRLFTCIGSLCVDLLKLQVKAAVRFL